LTIDNQELLLRPGMTATAEIIVQTVEDALLIPNAALRYTPPTIATEDSDKSFIQSIMPRPSRSSDVAKIDQPSNGDRRIWVLQDNEPIEVQIRVGVTDGVNTQVLTGDLKLDDQAILDNIETVN
jgi:HlyD family secretion protein